MWVNILPFLCRMSVTSSTLKVNFSPYLIDIVINGAVDPLRHKAKVRGGVLKITLFKTDDLSMWDSLEVCDIDKKDSLRLKSSLHQQDIEEKLSESRKDRKVADERHSVRKQMALEEAERNRLEGKKEEEKHIAEEEMYSTFSKLQTPQPHVPRTHVNEPMNDIDEIMGDSHPEVVSRGKRDVDLDDCSDMFDTNPESCDDGDLRYIPPPRSSCVSSSGSSGTVNINFTPRVFPTPMRESTQANEEDWIAKNRKHLKKHGTLGKNIPKGMYLISNDNGNALKLIIVQYNYMSHRQWSGCYRRGPRVAES
jgi:dyslexia susceptibility 1 candidate gene 1 protein